MAPTITNSTGVVPSNLVCSTPACLGLAADILFNLAANYTEIDPCTDFDKLACDGFRSKSTPAPGSGQASTFGTASIMDILKLILESPYPSGTGAGFVTESLSEDQVAVDQDNFKLITDAYNACLNYTVVEAVGLEPLIDLIDHIVEAFPEKSPEDLITKDDDLGKVLLIFSQYSIPTFELVAPIWDDSNPNVTIIQVMPGGESLLAFNEDDETISQYLAVQASVLQAVYPANLTAAKAEELASQITKFERELLNLLEFDDSKEFDNGPSRKFTLEEVTSVAPELGHDFIIKSLSPSGYVPEYLAFSPGYFSNLSALLATTTAETLKGFFVWKAAVTFSNYVEEDTIGQLNDMKKTLQGLDPNIIGRGFRWQQCVSNIEDGAKWIEFSNGLGWILGRFFLDKAYSEAARTLTTTLMTTIQTEFITRLADKDWLSAEVKKVAEEKVRTITKQIGYPDTSPNTVDPQDMAKYYSGLDIGDSFFNNTVNTALWYTAKLWSGLDEPTDKDVWLFSPSVVNAFYFPTFNDIFIQAGIQQQPLYDVDYPSYINYGSMGTILGHELTHGFDNMGHRYAPNGSLVNWFDKSSETGFQERSECFVQQYSNFYVRSPNGTRVYVEGNSTLGENIADAGGLTTSFAAWKRHQSNSTSTDKDLPGLGNFTHAQLFFLKWAQSWCDVSGSPARDVWLISNDVHSPGFARINGSLENSEEFKKAFNCPVKKPRCELW